MNFNKVRTALQDLIIRLQDAEKGYKKIEETSDNIVVKEWMSNYATERHEMHQLLEREMSKLGGNPEVKTSLLGDAHRLYIDLKFNVLEPDFSKLVDEIERGSNMLINDYTKVIEEVELPLEINRILVAQRARIKSEIEKLSSLQEKFEVAEA